MALIKSISKGNKTKWRLLGVQVARSVRRSIWTEWHVLGLTFRVPDRRKCAGLPADELEAVRDAALVFDIALGGGTEAYFHRWCESAVRLGPVVRIQYLSDVDRYLISHHTPSGCRSLSVVAFDDALKILKVARFREIVVSNLVSWPDVGRVLAHIAHDLKRDGTHVAVCGHDFYPVCPSVTMLPDGHRFCGGPDDGRCAKCRADIRAWRGTWEDFFRNAADEIRLFSESSRGFFVAAYPSVRSKMSVKPHVVPPLRMVSVPEHLDVNIAVVGAITYPAKGSEILAELDNLLARKSGVSLALIGESADELRNIRVLGKYRREELPDLLERLSADIVFVPSVCPETFSYVTAEAMSMGMAVACFPLGAPAERVARYAKGLVVSEVSALAALREIVAFVRAGRNV